MMHQLGLIGYPLSHSFSKRYFGAKFAREGIADYQYDLYPIASITELPALLAAQPRLVGLNVTIPYKEQILPYLQYIDPAATQVGAVNTVLRRHDGLHGYNTDVFGFMHSLRPLLQPQHTQALILGTGGAAKAVAYSLDALDIAHHMVSRRHSPKGLTYEHLTAEVVARSTLIINTTPLGMSPDTASYPPIPYEAIHSGHLLYDLVYNPAETAFLARGKMQGAATKNGLEMLELQAEKAWELFRSISSPSTPPFP